jgi:hypothetical protein
MLILYSAYQNLDLNISKGLNLLWALLNQKTIILWNIDAFGAYAARLNAEEGEITITLKFWLTFNALLNVEKDGECYSIIERMMFLA